MGMSARDIARNTTRTCGGCRACCDASSHFVVTTVKPAYGRCKHLTADGCCIYASKPSMCSAWACSWRLGIGDDADRPDLSGFYIDLGEATYTTETEAIRDAVRRRTGIEPLMARIQPLRQDLVGLVESAARSGAAIKELSVLAWDKARVPVCASVPIPGSNGYAMSFALMNGKAVERDAP